MEQLPILNRKIRYHLWDEAIERIGTEEGKAELRNLSGRHLLHQACQHSAAFHLIEAMLTEYPGLAKVTANDSYHRLPLHQACRPEYLNEVSPQVVRLLLDTHPEGAKATDDDGWLPLHYAASNSAAPLEILRMLIDAHPDGVATPNNIGELPIHNLAFAENEEYVENPLHANELPAFVENEERVERIKALYQPIQNNEEALLTRYDGKTPLHIAQVFDLLSVGTCVAIAHCPAEVISSVARHHPEQLCARDENGNYPLHFVASNPNLNGSRVLTKAPIRQSGDDFGVEGVEAADGDNEAGGDEDT